MEAELIDILILDFPLENERQDTFLDITGARTQENTISRIYAYFLNSRNHEIRHLFLDTLIELITEKSGESLDFNIGNPYSYLEYPTKRGRIDILVRSHDQNHLPDSGEQSTAIIIENKIYHALLNDLCEYYDFVDVASKKGVLLTLMPHALPLDDMRFYVNITHREWVDAIRRKGLPFSATLAEALYINDFIRNMEELTGKTGMSADAAFFFQHAPKIMRARKTYDEAYAFIVSQLNLLSSKMGMSFYGNGYFWRHIWDKAGHAQVYYAIVFGEAFGSSPKITVFLEVYRDSIKRAGDFRQLLEKKGLYQTLTYDSAQNASWAHLARKEYDLDYGTIGDLADTLHQHIQRDFQEAYDAVFLLADKNDF